VHEIHYHPKIPKEAREFLAYYEGISERLGDKFWAELTSAIDNAGKHPERHHYNQLGNGLRRSNLKNFPVHFLFRIYQKQIRITTLRHNKCKPITAIRRQ